ncbi:hypothetical protein L2E82_38425 [Cichorium intybus]|uniref:Uncharacterized protein n=1 Tax=Cichorium intybus TaxID=13427 RepID=A0ACB9AGM0_CICIN|nr:hypothetical protein L2E82_38425 [Cichorium intybus]
MAFIFASFWRLLLEIAPVVQPTWDAKSAQLQFCKGANSSVTLALFGYVTLTLVYGSILLYNRHQLIISWYWYALLAFFFMSMAIIFIIQHITSHPL